MYVVSVILLWKYNILYNLIIYYSVNQQTDEYWRTTVRDNDFNNMITRLPLDMCPRTHPTGIKTSKQSTEIYIFLTGVNTMSRNLYDEMASLTKSTAQLNNLYIARPVTCIVITYQSRDTYMSNRYFIRNVFFLTSYPYTIKST